MKLMFTKNSAVLINIVVSWVVTQCSLEGV
jgi:hypothetical protein